MSAGQYTQHPCSANQQQQQQHRSPAHLSFSFERQALCCHTAGGEDGSSLSGGTGSGTGGASSNIGGDAAKSACTTEIEQVLCGATIDTQTYWKTALPKFFGVPYQTTKTVFFTGSTNTTGPNGNSI
jgi:hypothetical protein